MINIKSCAINLEKFMSKKSALKLRNANFSKLAAIMERNKGTDVGDNINLENAVYLLGKKAYLKNVTHQRILTGLNAYNDVVKK